MSSHGDLRAGQTQLPRSGSAAQLSEAVDDYYSLQNRRDKDDDEDENMSRPLNAHHASSSAASHDLDVLPSSRPFQREQQQQQLSRRSSAVSITRQNSAHSLHRSNSGRRGMLTSQTSFSRGISAWGTVLESEHISSAFEIILVVPALVYAFVVLMWIFAGTDIEYCRELGPVSFAALCLHLFAGAESPHLTVWEMMHYGFHALCEMIVANYATLQLGGGVGGVCVTSILMFVFWPMGWYCLRKLRLKLNHTTRLQRLGNVAEGAIRNGSWLLLLTLYLGAESLSCMVRLKGGSTLR